MVYFKKKVFVVRDEVPYFSEALGFNWPSLLVNPDLAVSPLSKNIQPGNILARYLKANQWLPVTVAVGYFNYFM